MKATGRTIAAVCMYIFFFLAASGVDVSASEALDSKAQMLLDYQSFMRGDRDGAVRFALSAAYDLQGTPLAELAVRLALFYEPATLSSVNVGEAEARRVLGDGTAISSDLRDILRRFVARSLVTAGRREEAREIHERRGLAMSWYIAGPFTGRKAASFSSREIPEAGEILDRDLLADPPDAQFFRECLRRPPWRKVPENRSFPFIRPWRWSGRGGEGAMLLFSAVDLAETDNRSAFHILADSSWRLFVDGSLVAEVDKNSRESALEHVVTVPLSAGSHSVVLQVFPPRADISVRQARVGVRLDSGVPFGWNREYLPPVIESRPSSRREAKPLRYLGDLEAVRDESPMVTAAYAVACLQQGMPDTAAWYVEQAARTDPQNVNLQFLAGMLTAVNPLIPPERRRDEAMLWYRNALASKPDVVPSLLSLASHASRAGNSREALHYLDRAYAVNSSSLDVLLARGDWASQFASSAMASAAWDEAGRAYPNSPAVQIAIASQPQDGFLDMEKRLAACRAAVAAGPNDPEASLRLAAALSDSGNTQEAEYVLRNALELFNGEVEVMADIAEIYARMTLYRESIAVLSIAANLAPDNAGIWRRLGDITMESGDKDGAIDLWRVSLAADPGQFELSDMVNAMENNARRFFNPGTYDAVAMTAATDPNDFSGDLVRLLDRSVLIFAADGSYRRLTHEIDMALTRRGGEQLTAIDTSGELLTARIVFPNGNTLEPEPYPDRDGLRLPVIMPGASREVRFLESVSRPAVGEAAVYPWYFLDPDGKTMFQVSELVVRAPKNLPLSFVVRRFGYDIEYERSVDGDYDVHRWTARLPQPVDEPDSVHISERVPSVEVAVKTTWDDVAYDELRRLDGRLIPSKRMQNLLVTLEKTVPTERPDPEQLARAIYRYVCDTIESAPSGGFASHIYADRIGDRSMLLLAFLRAAGLDADPAAARPDAQYLFAPTWDLPRRDIFTVPLVRLVLPGGKIIWLDTRFDSLPFGYIADDLSGATALAFLVGGPLFEPLPNLSAEESMVYNERLVRLPQKADAPLVISGRVMHRGVAGLERERTLAETDSEGKKRLALKMLYPVFPDALLDRLEIMRTEDDEASALERYEASSSFPVEPRPDGRIAAGLCMAPLNPVTQEARKAPVRRTACHIDSLHIAEDRNTFALPQGATIVAMPESAHIPSRFGVYQLRVTRHSSDSVEIVRTYHIPAQRIQPWEWDEFVSFLQRIDLAEKQWLEYSFNKSE